MNFRFKIGELVELSAAGRKRHHNDKVYDKIGIVLRYGKDDRGRWDQYPYIIQWTNFEFGGDGTFPMKEYEIKRVRGAKCK